MPSHLQISRNFLGSAISTTSSSRNGYQEYSIGLRTPLTPRRTPRYEAYSGTDFPRKPLQDSSGFSSPSSSTFSSSTENVTFLERSPRVLTLALTHDSSLEKYKLGTFPAVNIILGKTIGVGVYSVPSSIFANVGSVGMALVVWVVGAAISFCGLAVYLDLGTALPKSGGEKVYLERVFRHPKMLATCMFMIYVVLLGFSTPNCIVLGDYAMYAVGVEVNRWNVRTVAVIAVTGACTMHARYPRLSLGTINVLGIGKMITLAIVVFSGLAAGLMSIGEDDLYYTGVNEQLSTAQRNFGDLFASSSTQPYDYATALLKVLYCFRGYNTANQVLSEVRNPVQTLKFAAPLALILVSASYILVNVAFFCAVEKDDFRDSGVVVAGCFFRNVFGAMLGERVFSWFVIFSAFGSIAATSFAQARVNQELAKEGLLPFSSFWASNKPWGTPAPALFLHWLVSVLAIVVPPPGEIYNFLVEIGGYPVSVISVAVSAGLLYLQNTPAEKWRSPCPARQLYSTVFLFSNIVLLILPWVRPSNVSADARFAYYAYPATGVGMLALGVVYWTWWQKLQPWCCNVQEQMIRSALYCGDVALRDWEFSVKESRGGMEGLS
ncbi:hypothetical protein MMC20_005556 [Loxospora ochrophaea]|nr:hypothetical protein [Loxospora ochrophaea]